MSSKNHIFILWFSIFVWLHKEYIILLYIFVVKIILILIQTYDIIIAGGDKMETKDILKALRKSKGFANAKDFCEISGISYNTYQNYETGKRLPTADFLIKIADFYGVTTDYLLGHETQPDELQKLVNQMNEQQKQKLIAIAEILLK